MNTVSEFRSLADDDLDRIIGGAPSCEVGLAIQRAYASAGKVWDALGDHVTAAEFYGKGAGVAEASCYLG